MVDNQKDECQSRLQEIAALQRRRSVESLEPYLWPDGDPWLAAEPQS
jgi:hypothetical protein